jgi:hypothetical protein
VELAVVLALLAILTMSGLYWQMDAIRDKVGVALADNLAELDTAVSKTYLIKNNTALLNGMPVAGVADAYHPTVSELKAAGFLSQAFSPRSVLGSGYRIELLRVPAGCVPSACDLQSLVLLDTPVLVRGGSTPDSVVLGTAQQRAGGNAGTSIDAPGVLSGPGGSWTLPNPLGLAGVIAIRGGYNASGLAGYLQANGSTPITNLVVAGTACAASYTYGVSAQGAFLTCQGGVWAGQGSRYWKDPVATFAVLPVAGNNTGDVRMVTAISRAFAWDGALWRPLGIDQNGDLLVPSNLSVQGNATTAGNLAAAALTPTGVVVAGAACPAGTVSGTMAKDNGGAIYSCQGGIWKQASPGSSGIVGDSSRPSVLKGPMYSHYFYTENRSLGYYYIDSSGNFYSASPVYGVTLLGNTANGSRFTCDQGGSPGYMSGSSVTNPSTTETSNRNSAFVTVTPTDIQFYGGACPWAGPSAPAYPAC